MIIYNTKLWRDSIWKIWLSMHWGNNYKLLLRAMIFILIYAGAITYFNINHFNIKFRIDPFFFSLLGLILSLFMVFRLNSAYDRWWEGRNLWGNLVNNSRTLAAYMAAIIKEEDLEERKYFAMQISNFSYALKGHLRNDIQYDNFEFNHESDLEVLKGFRNIPYGISSQIFSRVEGLYRKKLITDVDKLNIKSEVAALIDVLGACERIKNTPIPFSHSSFFKSFLLIYIFSLPFGFVNSFLYFTIPASLLITYALLGVEIISEEIEEPFGKDPNDLPITYLSGVIRKDVYHILGTNIDMPDIIEPVKGSAHFNMIH